MTTVGVTLLVVGLACLLVAEVHHSRMKIPAKLVASTGFLVVAIGEGALDTPYGSWILAGLCLSWVGDAALLGRSDTTFLLGLTAFLVGHLAYVVAFVTTDLDPTLPAVLFGVAWVGTVTQVARWLLPNVTGRMRGPVIVYISVITTMVVLAGPAGVGTNSLLLPLGAISFAVSDIAVARDRFVSPGIANRMWGLPLYYAGQLLLAFSVNGVQA